MSTAGDRSAARASAAVLPPGAAHRSATDLPATSPAMPGDQGGGRVLHPPGPLGVAGQVFDAAWETSRFEPVVPSAAEPLGPRRPPTAAISAGFHAEVERRPP